MLAGSLACLLDAVSLHYWRPAGAKALPDWFTAAPPVPRVQVLANARWMKG